MCGVLGYKTISPCSTDLELIRNLFLEAGIRGQHATGISWLSGDEIKTVKLSVGSEEFLTQFNLEQIINSDNTITMVGHIRYSTSDVRYNQPFTDAKYAIVHNGVISQEAPENWPIKCETRNDSEMVLHSLSDHKYKHPLEEFPDSSQAVVYLCVADKLLGGWRNGQRPLWYSETKDERLVFASTQDILKRSGIETQYKMPMNQDIFMTEDGELMYQHYPTNKKDLQ